MLKCTAENSWFLNVMLFNGSWGLCWVRSETSPLDVDIVARVLLCCVAAALWLATVSSRVAWPRLVCVRFHGHRHSRHETLHEVLGRLKSVVWNWCRG